MSASDRLQHMLDAALKVRKFVENETRSSFEQNEILSLAVLHLLEIIGEAASKVPADIRDTQTEIEWKPIIGMRNRLTHGYFDVNYDIVWNTVQDKIPPLIGQLQKIIPLLRDE